MARASLHTALLVDRATLAAAADRPETVDPVVKVAALPGPLAPCVALRSYRGPQGAYVEQIRLLDAAGVPRYTSPTRRLELAGDEVVTTLRHELDSVVVDSSEEHTLVCTVDGAELARVPVFIAAAEGGDPRTASRETLTQALKKSTILWVEIPQTDAKGRDSDPLTRPVWFVADRHTVYVLTGPDEQELPGIEQAAQVRLVARGKDTQSRILDLPCAVEAIGVEDRRYAAFESAALTRRLNLPDGDAAAARWRATCRLYGLTPQGIGVEPAPPPAPPAADPTPEQPGKPAGQPAIDEALYERLIAEGTSERAARAKAKAAFVRAQRARERN